jgi:hypothetical protein
MIVYTTDNVDFGALNSQLSINPVNIIQGRAKLEAMQMGQTQYYQPHAGQNATVGPPN